jgi:fatty acid CoA ligase FadD28
VINRSIPSVLREHAGLQPNETAFTFISYEQDRDGVAESLTWSQLYRRSLNLAGELRRRGSAGDRAVILAPQGLNYIDAFLGALQAGLVPVPLAVPVGGASDERVISVLRDASPSVILTTSAVADTVAEYANQQADRPAPSIVEVDSLDLDARTTSRTSGDTGSDTTYLQYTSGSTRSPAGVMVTYRNLLANFEQMMANYFCESGNVPPPDTTFVSWLPFYHDMGLILGICVPVLSGIPTLFTSPVSFLQRPARWMQLMASGGQAFTAAPNFAFELAVRKTSDDDMAGLDLANVHTILNGSERVQPATLKRFTERFARFNLCETVIRPSYGLAEATVYVASRRQGRPFETVHFESEKLAEGHATRCATDSGTPLVGYGVPQSPMVRIVDQETRIERPSGEVGEIWVHGANVATGYWGKPEETERVFDGRLVAPPAGTPDGPWLRTGDLGFFFNGELFIIGRIKDLLIVYGRNHSPDDIEATIQEITRGRCAAISVPDDGTEKLVAIIELKKRGDSDEETVHKHGLIKSKVTSAISKSHGLSVADLVLVPPGSIPTTTSGKVRRRTCVEHYRQDQFARLDA